MTSSHHGPYDQGYVLQWHIQEKRPRESMDLIKYVVVRIGVCNSTHEVGIASNRRSECYGEYVPEALHTARHTMGVGCKRSR